MFGKSDTEKDLQSRVKQYKPHWNPKEVIEYKDEHCAVLQKTKGERVEFLIAFSDLTKEGYKLMATFMGKGGGSVMSGIDIAFFYFQKT